MNEEFDNFTTTCKEREGKRFKFYLWELPYSKKAEIENSGLDFIRTKYLYKFISILECDYLISKNGLLIGIRFY